MYNTPIESIMYQIYCPDNDIFDEHSTILSTVLADALRKVDYKNIRLCIPARLQYLSEADTSKMTIAIPHSLIFKQYSHNYNLEIGSSSYSSFVIDDHDRFPKGMPITTYANDRTTETPVAILNGKVLNVLAWSRCKDNNKAIMGYIIDQYMRLLDLNNIPRISVFDVPSGAKYFSDIMEYLCPTEYSTQHSMSSSQITIDHIREAVLRLSLEGLIKRPRVSTAPMQPLPYTLTSPMSNRPYLKYRDPFEEIAYRGDSNGEMVFQVSKMW